MIAETVKRDEVTPGALEGPRRGAGTTPVLYLLIAGIVIAEYAAAREQFLLAASIDAAVIAVAINCFVLGGRDGEHPGAFAALSLVPLLRLVSMGMAVEDPVVSLCASGAPLLMATVLLGRTLHIPTGALLLRGGGRSRWPLGLGGLALGALAAAALTPRPLVADPSWPVLVAALLAVFVFAGVLEELIFRGVLQTCLPGLGRWPSPEATLLFASVYVGGGWGAMGAAAVGGAAAAWWTARTNSLGGVAVAHGASSAEFLVGWPLLFT